MAVDVASGVLKGYTFFSTAGTSAAASPVATAQKAMIMKGMQQMGSAVAQEVSQKTVKYAADANTRQIAITKAQKALGDQVSPAAVSAYCTTIFDTLMVTKPSLLTAEGLANAVDIFGVQSIIADCKNIKSDTNAALACAKDWVLGSKMIDPTGLLTIAATFIQPTCGLNQGAEVQSETQ